MQEILLLRKTLPSRSSQNIHQRKYLCEVIHAQSSILYLSEGQNSGCQMSGSVSLQGDAFDSMVLHKNLVQSGFYTSQKV